MERDMWSNRTSAEIEERLADVEAADRRIASTREHIADQEQRIAQADIEGRDTAPGWKLRQLFFLLLATHEQQRAWLVKWLHA